MSDVLTSTQTESILIEKIGSRLASQFKIQIISETGSTNDDIKELGRSEKTEGHVIATNHQTTGRGRRGDQWTSPPNKNLLFSILLRPQTPIETWSRLPLLSGLAIARAIETTYPEVGKIQLKWPNDLYLGEKKLGGILLETELFKEPHRNFCVLGAGINVNIETHEFPPDLQSIATTLFTKTNRIVSRNELLATILSEWLNLYPTEIEQFEAAQQELRERNFLHQKKIKILTQQQDVEGIVADIGPSGELILQTNAAEAIPIYSCDHIEF